MNEYHRVVALGALAEGSLQAHRVDGRDIVLCRTREGVFALDDRCSHALARMSEGRLRGNRLICPLHGASFDVRDGRVLGAPATRPLTVHRVRIVGDHVEVALQPETSDST
ncbi:MAG: non-heme iron oxygenase ferredoxin subunit [Steroidobacteraceae bacterium]|nr:non-heme iron oxygenase ferredoxin subunit [Steroidobacteraceae bacterium]MDW8260213.1 non-heme iron oxygenase ferredoxin subunit [Gammaproteobacteria bacterium]